MNQHVKKWGNSAAVRISAATLAAAGLKTDDPIDVREEGGRIVIEKISGQEITLDWLLEGLTPDRLHPEVSDGGPVGKEIWW